MKRFGSQAGVLAFQRKCEVDLMDLLRSLNLSISRVNMPYCIINGLNINRVTIYRAKCLGTVTLRVLLTSRFRSNSEKKSTHSVLWRLSETESVRVSQYKVCNKAFRGFRENDHFFNKSFSPFISKKLHINFNPSQNVSYFIASWFGEGYR